MSEWISVKDRLPDDGTQVLATGWDDGLAEGKRHIVIAELCRDDWFTEDGDQQFPYLTHWQPLPQPPQGK